MELSTSRVFLSNPLYGELESDLERIFDRPVLVAPTTTLAHLAALPSLTSSDDVVLLDQQVHSSVQMTAKVLMANGVKVEFVPHANIQRIERKIKAYKDSKRKIWYLGDGVYSMYGDCAQMRELENLLDTYEQFNLYLDDAHGMSWRGEKGKGYVLDKLPNHERLYLITSLAKGFGTGGGVITTPDRELKQLIRNCGGPLLFSGPLQPPILGAALASAKIHLSADFPGMQEELRRKIDQCNVLLENQPLPLLSSPDSPIKFLGIGSTELAQSMVKELMRRGFWLNIAQFPAVAPHHAGLRFMLNRCTLQQDLEEFIVAIREAAYLLVGKDESTLSGIWSTFSKDYRYSLVHG
jgi:7-keto-8-aminopelargonate synthetase-like enzyme